MEEEIIRTRLSSVIVNQNRLSVSKVTLPRKSLLQKGEKKSEKIQVIGGARALA